MNFKSHTPTKEEKQWMDSISELGCIVCINLGYGFSPCSPHHMDGKVKKGSHLKTIPLCAIHHQTGGYGVAFHQGRFEWEKNNGTQQELLNQVTELLNV